MRRRFVIGAAVGFTIGLAVVGRTLLGPAGVVLGAVYSATFTAAGTVPTCSTGESCTMSCVADTGGTDWVCTGPTGTDLPVTLGAGTDFVSTPFVGATKALNDVNDAKAPTLTSPAAMESFWTTPHTVIVGGYSTDQTASSHQGYLQQTSGVAGFYMRQETGINCAWFNNGATPTAAVVVADINVKGLNGWAVSSCRKSLTGANSSYTARISGQDTVTAWGYDPQAPTGGTFYFGRILTAGLPLRGPMAFANFYSVAKSDAWLTSAESAFWGTTPTTGSEAAAVTRGQTAWQIDDNGYAAAYDHYVPRTTSSGLYIESDNTNAWAADALAAATWTDVGTPTVTSNTASGPFSRWKNAAEADLIVDDDAAAFEGKQSASAGTSAGKYTASCYLKQGTSGVTTTKARLVVTTDGTGSTNCDKTITSSFVRYECTTTIGGTPTFVRGQLLVGNATTDTGSILVSQCQLEANGWASSPKANNTAIGTETATISTTETANWPLGTQRGEAEVVFILDHDIPGDDFDNNNSIFLLDTRSSDGGPGILMWYQQSEGKWKVSTRDGVALDTAGNSASDSSASITAGQMYVMRFRWVPDGNGKLNHFFYLDTCASVSTCTATTQIGSGTARTAHTEHGIAYLGSRYNNQFRLNGRIARLTVRE